MRILALDPSLSCTGWAVGDSKDGKPLTWGSIKTMPSVPTPARYYHICTEVLEVFNVHECDVLVIEGLHVVRNMKTVKLLAGLTGALRLHFWDKKSSELIEFTPGQVRKAIGLKGNARKPEVAAAMWALGHATENLDETDALAVWYASLKILDIPDGK